MVKTKVIQEELKVQKLVGRAKGVLMKWQNLSEEASKRICKASRDSRKTRREIGEAILLTDKMGGQEHLDIVLTDSFPIILS